MCVFVCAGPGRLDKCSPQRCNRSARFWCGYTAPQRTHVSTHEHTSTRARIRPQIVQLLKPGLDFCRPARNRRFIIKTLTCRCRRRGALVGSPSAIAETLQRANCRICLRMSQFNYPAYGSTGIWCSSQMCGGVLFVGGGTLSSMKWDNNVWALNIADVY